jgi:hypothetical protein
MSVNRHSQRNVVIMVCIVLVSIFFMSLDVSAAEIKAKKRYLYVQSGQTLQSIVKTLYPDKSGQWTELGKRIVMLNPRAFEKGDASKIIIGSRLELPDLTVVEVKPPEVKKPVVQKPKPVPPPVVVEVKKPETVGMVVDARGKTFAIASDKKNRPLEKGSELYVGDRIYTGMDGFMQMSMIDDAKIDLRCNSEMLIEEYKMVPNGNRSIMHLIKGSLRKVTGSIGKSVNDVYEMKTSIATVGVRGTEYAIRVLQSHGCDGSLDVNDSGMFVRVDKGEIDVKNDSGDTPVAKGDVVHVVAKKDKPKKIDAKQGVFEAVKPEEPVKEEPFNWWWVVGVLVVIAAL